MAKFVGKFRDVQNSENSGCYKAVSFDLIDFDFNIKVYEPLWMYVLSMNLVVQSTHYPLHCDSLATVLINNLVSFVSVFLSCHFLVNAKWLFCGTEIRYIYTHHGSCDNALPVWCHSSSVRRRCKSIRRIANRHFLMFLWRPLCFKAWAKKRKPRSIHLVSEFIIRKVLYVLNHWEE